MPKPKLKIYLDTNVYGRLFDDWSQPKVLAEAQASSAILSLVKQGKFYLISSDILSAEVFKGKPDKRLKVLPLLQLASKRISENSVILQLALKIKQQCQLHDKDALHLASAIAGQAIIFITCDERVSKKTVCLEQQFHIKAINPLNFISAYE